MRHPGPPYEVVGVNLDRASSARAKPTSEGVVFHHADDKFLIAAEADKHKQCPPPLSRRKDASRPQRRESLNAKSSGV
jgi:hypothetical protein